MQIIQMLAAFFFVIQCVAQPSFDENEWLDTIQKAESSALYEAHVDSGGKFFNPWIKTTKIHFGGSWQLYQLFTLGKKYDIFPIEEYSAVNNDYIYLLDNSFDSISFYGHATLIVKLDGETIFTDPFFSEWALAAKKKVQIEFDFSNVPDKPIVLISHNHYDHLDEYSVKELIKKNAVFIVPLGLKDFFSGLGATEVFELDWWQSVELKNMRYTFLPSQHVSRRIGYGSMETLWGSFLIEGSKTIYFSGDTGYFHGFKEFGKLYSIDYALLGAGAYEPRWFMHLTHLGVDDFFRAAKDINAKTAIPIHFGIIQMTDEPILYPLYKIRQFLNQYPEYAERIHTLRAGEYLEIR